TYVLTNVMEEIFLHQLTRYATTQAMREAYPIIYSAFYSYDSMAHAFGPEADYSFRSLRQIDRSIRRIASWRQRAPRDYELLVLSDHGQTESLTFNEKTGRSLGQYVCEFLPACEIDEYNGRKFTPTRQPESHVVLTYSGGLAHLYFKDVPTRMTQPQIEEQFPQFIQNVAQIPGIGFVMVRGENGSDVIITRDNMLCLGEQAGSSASTVQFLSRFDDPNIVASQLHKLNSFRRSGDLIIFGEYDGQQQVNFENQIGGHGSLGGEQMFPFVLAKREWAFDTSRVSEACELYPQLKRLRDRLIRMPQTAPAVEEHSLVLAT
ncbi:MAG: alkaline phosphatase family protein, partial [Chloroflexi bacterium]|nr:alkaline phosphatase family protein [Chloroflexota bacterium]